MATNEERAREIVMGRFGLDVVLSALPEPLLCESLIATVASELNEADRRGYARAQADVVAWLRSPGRILREECARIADGIEDECHVGAGSRGE